jgi:hypothetical protein
VRANDYSPLQEFIELIAKSQLNPIPSPPLPLKGRGKTSDGRDEVRVIRDRIECGRGYFITFRLAILKK